MPVTMTFTDEQAKALTEELTHIEPYAGTPLREVLDMLLPPKPNPRTLPPGPELDELACRAMGTWACTSYGVCEHNYSSAMGFVGQMLDWLHERQYRTQLNSSEVGHKVWFRHGGKSIWSHSAGETPQHALAIAVAVVGGNDV